MPKTRNAFAFFSFNGERILQRPFFRHWRELYHVGDDLSDKEILATLTVDHTEDNNILILQSKLDTLDELLSYVEKYQKRIENHSDKFTKYQSAVGNKIATDTNVDINQLRTRYKRAGELAERYTGRGGIDFEVGRLRLKVEEQYAKVSFEVNHFYRKIFADRLKHARQSAGMTQLQLSKKLKMSQRVVSNYESAQREPSIATLLRLAQTLNRPVGWLLGDEPL